jgi:WD40 repeat protein
VWSVSEDYEELKTITNHEAWIRALLYLKKGNTMISASFDRTIKVFGLDDYQCIKTISIDEHPEAMCLLQNGYFAISTLEGAMYIWDSCDFKPINIFSQKEGISRIIFLNDNRLVTSSYYGL